MWETLAHTAPPPQRSADGAAEEPAQQTEGGVHTRVGVRSQLSSRPHPPISLAPRLFFSCSHVVRAKQTRRPGGLFVGLRRPTDNRHSSPRPSPLSSSHAPTPIAAEGRKAARRLRLLLRAAPPRAPCANPSPPPQPHPLPPPPTPVLPGEGPQPRPPGPGEKHTTLASRKKQNRNPPVHTHNPHSLSLLVGRRQGAAPHRSSPSVAPFPPSPPLYKQFILLAARRSLSAAMWPHLTHQTSPLPQHTPPPTANRAPRPPPPPPLTFPTQEGENAVLFPSKKGAINTAFFSSLLRVAHPPSSRSGSGSKEAGKEEAWAGPRQSVGPGAQYPPPKSHRRNPPPASFFLCLVVSMSFRPPSPSLLFLSALTPHPTRIHYPAIWLP